MKFFIILSLCLFLSNASLAQETSANFSGGSVIIGPDTRDCDAGLEKSLRYNASTDAVEYCDGTDWQEMGGSGGGGGGSSDVYDLALFVPGSPGNSASVRYAIPRAVRLPQNLTDSQCVSGSAADSSVTVTLKKISASTTTIGSAVWASSSSTCSFTFSSNVDFAAGDILEVLFPDSVDSGLADVSITFAGQKL